jgi:hypothetical protein
MDPDPGGPKPSGSATLLAIWIVIYWQDVVYIARKVVDPLIFLLNPDFWIRNLNYGSESWRPITYESESYLGIFVATVKTGTGTGSKSYIKF